MCFFQRMLVLCIDWHPPLDKLNFFEIRKEALLFFLHLSLVSCISTGLFLRWRLFLFSCYHEDVHGVSFSTTCVSLKDFHPTLYVLKSLLYWRRMTFFRDLEKEKEREGNEELSNWNWNTFLCCYYDSCRNFLLECLTSHNHTLEKERITLSRDRGFQGRKIKKARPTDRDRRSVSTALSSCREEHCLWSQ
jgi:hypothetical protein